MAVAGDCTVTVLPVCGMGRLKKRVSLLNECVTAPARTSVTLAILSSASIEKLSVQPIAVGASIISVRGSNRALPFFLNK